MLRSRVTKVLLAIVFLAVSQMAIGQEKVEMADGMRSSGKIYVVVAVLAIIFSGLLIFLIHIDRKVSKLEKESQKSKL
ncbi:MAG TPA: CcmD family protein [Agriterribacter sp.]|nr:CcmD family protein [Chitinophagaceae bacterium]HRP33087.1 CcmD family protein [Agriterribacter sp.]